MNKDKTFWGTTLLQFLGMLIDTVKQLVCIPVQKINRAKELIFEIISKKKVKVHELQRLCGFLNFLCRAIVPGHAFTQHLYAYTGGRGAEGAQLKPHHHVKVNGEMKADLTMWLVFLNKSLIYCRPFMDYSYCDAVDLDFFTDASRNFSLGFGGVYGTKWMYAQWDEFTKQQEPSIEYLELFAVTAGVLLWCKNFQNRCVHIFCDNMSVVFMLNNMSSSCRNCMVLIRLITLECMCNNFRQACSI